RTIVAPERAKPGSRLFPRHIARPVNLSLDADPASAQGEALGVHLSPSRSEYHKKSCRTSMRRCEGMGKLVFGMMQSLDGYVDGVTGRLEFPPPGVGLARHFNDRVRGLAGCLYGRRIYEIMRYWDEDRPDWDAVDRDFAAAWRAQPKWVVSRTLKSVGANATLVAENVDAFVRRLK